jgi:hypothetical protein
MPTESHLRDAAVRLRVRELIKNGRLPVSLVAQIDTGYGSGCVCAACDSPITSRQVQFEVDCLDHRLRLHIGCHVVWQIECWRPVLRQ